jgi:hypothetical protein
VVKKMLRSMVAAVALVVIGTVIFVPSASASGWTVLGGDPLFPGGIPNANQQGRDKLVHDMLSHKGVLAQKRAGLNQRERQATKQALVRGEFKQCTLHYGDQFEFMSYGVGTIFVDHNVTFKDPRYKGHGAPAFCLTVEVGKGGEVIELKIPFKCENFGGNRKKLKPAKPEKPGKPKPKPKPKPAPAPSPETPSTPPPSSPPPTQTKQKPWAKLMEPQEVDVNKSSELCASLYDPSGDEIEVEFVAETGHFLGLPIYEPGYSPSGVCDFYTAGSDPGTDHFWVVIYDITTKEVIESGEVKPITVKEPETEHGGWH